MCLALAKTVMILGKKKTVICFATFHNQLVYLINTIHKAEWFHVILMSSITSTKQ